MDNFHFKANITLISTEDGGRTTLVLSGYRPAVCFDGYPGYLTSGSQTYIDKEKVLPGDSAVAGFHIASFEYFKKRLSVGRTFTFQEGGIITGSGVITEIINKDLEIDPNDKEEDLNLNLYPRDIVDQLKYAYGDMYGKAIVYLHLFLIENKLYRNPRLIRAIIFLSEMDLGKLQSTIEMAKIDPRDILLKAEYENPGLKNAKRVRDFNQVFGSEYL